MPVIAINAFRDGVSGRLVELATRAERAVYTFEKKGATQVISPVAGATAFSFEFFDTQSGSILWELRSFSLTDPADLRIVLLDVGIGVLSPTHSFLKSGKGREMTVFIPGLMGSVLQKNGTQVWPPVTATQAGMATLLTLIGQSGWFMGALAMLSLSRLASLQLNADGTDADGIEAVPTGAVESVLGVSEIYKPILDHFRAPGSTLFDSLDELHPVDRGFIVFPYDWRKDLHLTAGRLRDFIEAVRQKANVDKVNVIGHSMGGLLTLTYATLYQRQAGQSVNASILIGEPMNGTPEALLALSGDVYGGISNARAAVQSIISRLTPNALLSVSDTIKAWASGAIEYPADYLSSFVGSFPSVYQLLPTEHYDTLGQGFVRIAGVSRPIASRAAYSLFGHRLQPKWVDRAYELHQAVGQASAGFKTRFRFILGQSANTTSAIAFKVESIEIRSWAQPLRGLAATAQGKIVGANASLGLWRFAPTKAGDGFQIVDAQSSRAIECSAADTIAELAAIDAARPQQVWNVNADGAFESALGLVLQLDATPDNTGAYPVRGVHRPSTDALAKWYVGGMPEMEITTGPGDGTVTSLGSIGFPTDPYNPYPSFVHMLERCDHIQIVQDARAFGIIDYSLLISDDRTG
jgi:pimeloyl-ACP methyl ester carboxylesterase